MKQNKSNFFAIAAIIIVGVVFQLIILFSVVKSDALFWPDPKHYYSIASDLSDGKPYSTAKSDFNIYRSPGYPFILSLMMRIVGKNIINLYLFHIALFPAFLLMLYKIGTLWENYRVGLIFALLGVLYPFYIYIPLGLYPESVLIYITPGIAILMFYIRNKMNYLLLFLLSGLISLAVMLRPTSIYWIPVVLIYILWHNGYKVKNIIAISALVILMPTVFVGAWSVRNKIIHNNFTFATAGSMNFVTSYNENADWRIKIVVLPENIQKRVFSAKNSAEVYKIYVDEAKKFILSHPLKAAKIAFMQCLDLWNPIPRTLTTGGVAQLKYKIIVAIPYLFFLIIGVIGIIIKRKDFFVQSLLMAMILNTVINGVIMISVRYRVVTDFAFIMTAAYAIDTIMARYKLKRAKLHRDKIKIGGAPII